MNTRTATYIGLIILLLLSAWLGFSFYSKEKEKQLSEKWAEDFQSFENLEKSFPAQSANHSALNLEKLCAPLGIELAPKRFKNRPRPDKQTSERIRLLSKDLSKVLETRLNHESSERAEMPEELRNYLLTSQPALEEIVSTTIANVPPVWELNLQKHIYAPFPNLSGHLALQRFINLKASLLIEESRTAEAERMLEASWKINEQLLKRPEEITYMIGQNILKLQLGNLRQMRSHNIVWNKRIRDHEIAMQLWKVLQADVLVILRAADEGRLGLDENGKRPFGMPPSALIRLMVFNWSEVMHSKVLELKRRDPCSPKKPLKIGEEKKVLPSWNTIGRIMYHDPANLWNRTMLLKLDLDLTNSILEIKKKLQEDSDAFGDAFSFESKACKDEQWNYKKTADGFNLKFSKKTDWEVADFSPAIFYLPDKYTSSKRK